jgi:hypothetical protein
VSTAVAVPVAPAATEAAPGLRRRLVLWLRVTALGLAAAGGLHVAAAADHLESGNLAVGFFLLAALAQVGLAGWLLLTSWAGSAPDRRLLGMAVLGTVTLLGLYVVAHTTSLLDAFAVHEAASGHAHDVPGREILAIDPITGVDFTEGMPIATNGPVAMAGDPVAATHGAEALGTATVAAELVALLGLTALLPAAWRRHTVNGLFALGGLAWVLWLTGVLA